MHKYQGKWRPIKITTIAVTLLNPTLTFAASCCGGGSSSGLTLPKTATAMIDLSINQEIYNGFWLADGTRAEDPPGSDLKQFRFNTGFAYRLADNWQTSIVMPYTWNRNKYSGTERNTHGLGDTSISLLYEAFDDITCVWKVRKLSDLKPSIYWGASLTLPTGTSPYDDVSDNFDITGRGFYRVDGTLHVEKTIYPFTAAVTFSHGVHIKRPVNKENGNYVEPYNKQLGNRTSITTAASYTHFMESLDTLTATVSYNYLTEEKSTIDGVKDSASGFKKNSITTALAWANSDNQWILKLSWNHSIDRDNWGENFPITDVFTTGVSYVFQ